MKFIGKHRFSGFRGGRHNWSEMSKLDETIRQLHFADAKILGFVYNGKSVESKYYKKRGYYSSDYYYYKK